MIRHARRLIVFVIGSTIVLLGVIMIIAPGPAFIVIPVGLGILGTEFMWARNLLKRMRDHAEDVARYVSGSRETPPSEDKDPPTP